jgi:uncharacterized protein YbbC (DUF1343 family)/CubicO group peptidase (beta-lactamase class C family)
MPPIRDIYRLLSVSLLAGFLLGCQGPQTTPPKPSPPPVVLNTAKLAELDAEIKEAIADGKCPGGVLWFQHHAATYRQTYGNRSLLPAVESMTEHTIFDLASLTKVVATAPAILRLIEDGAVKLDASVTNYIPEFTGEQKEGITIRHLLTHTSGLRPGLGRRPEWSGSAKAIEFACGEKLRSPTGSKFIYSDINYILLGEIVQRVSGKNLQAYTRSEIYAPLGMINTGFLPPERVHDRTAPTEKLRDGTVLRGTVHDPTSRRMGGIAGHAGLFSTAGDLARYARMLLNHGELDGRRIFQEASIRLMTEIQSPPEVREGRGIGWDIDSGYSGPRGQIFPGGSFGHTGWTGTSLWIDPFSKSFVIFLSNRNHPTEKGSVVQLRKRISTLVAEAIPNGENYFSTSSYQPNFPVKETLPSNKVLNGIDSLKRKDFGPLKGLKIGLITNHTGRDRKGNSTIDLLHRTPAVELRALFSPEHGIRGEKDEKVGDGKDDKTGLPVYSLYGKRRSPTPEQLAGLDALVFDIQDIGCRFYTYISTMGLGLEAAGKAGIKFFVLDRTNPINGSSVQGPIHLGKQEFIAFHSIPLRHGMTVGELAKMFNAEKGYQADLTVIPMNGWQREMWFEDTSLPWKNPSPNMRDMAAAVLYPGAGLVEFSVSVGRGTPNPFHVIGAPYANGAQLAKALNQANLAGVRFHPVTFTPESSIFAKQKCEGVRLDVTDRNSLNSVTMGVTIAAAFQRLYPENFNLAKVNRLLQHTPTWEAIRDGKSLAEIRNLWIAGRNDFLKRRQKYLLY